MPLDNIDKAWSEASRKAAAIARKNKSKPRLIKRVVKPGSAAAKKGAAARRKQQAEYNKIQNMNLGGKSKHTFKPVTHNGVVVGHTLPQPQHPDKKPSGRFLAVAHTKPFVGNKNGRVLIGGLQGHESSTAARKAVISYHAKQRSAAKKKVAAKKAKSSLKKPPFNPSKKIKRKA